MAEETKSFFCPRCDRPGYKTLDKLKKHVELQHPDYDPEWYQTGELI